MKRVLRMLSNAGYAVTLLFPWPVRRWLLRQCYGYDIDRTARIGLSWIRPRKLVMRRDSRVGHLNVCKGLDMLSLGEHASIGRLNWITGFPSGHPVHFAAEADRVPSLFVGDHSAITHRHIIDCTNRIDIGKFATVAGFRSQFLTHSIDLGSSTQGSHPISIGDYAFVGTAVVVLGGAVLPGRSVLAAGAVLNKAYTEEEFLYAGAPARPVKRLERSLGYFNRTRGFVD